MDARIDPAAAYGINLGDAHGIIPVDCRLSKPSASYDNSYSECWGQCQGCFALDPDLAAFTWDERNHLGETYWLRNADLLKQ